MDMTLVFAAPGATAAEIAGGKGANLALLTQRGFPVPPGFVVTADGYREFIRSAEKCSGRLPVFHPDDPAALASEAASLRAALESIPLPDALILSVCAQLKGFPPDAAFSVRSSSTFEDLSSAAFAGQHDTYLNVIGEENVLKKLRSCFASLWQERAIAYRSRMGFDHAAATMAVVVQRMIPCEVSGVGFTINPVSGALDEMLVNANYGLGESVVGGEGEIDQYVLSRDGSLKSSVIGRKTRKVRCAQHGSEEIAVPDADAGRPCLSSEQLAGLATLMRRVEESYQFPQDIEWGYAGGNLYLLQSRPVTTIPPRWTRDESAERFPNAITPLTWDMVEQGFHRSLNHSFRLMNFPSFSGKWFGMHGHYIYGNQNAVEVYGRRAPFRISSLSELEAALPLLRERFAWVQSLPVEWSRDLDRYLLTIGELMVEPLKEKDLRGVWDFVLRVNRLGADYFLPNIAISLTQRMLYKVLLGLLSLLCGSEEEGARLFDDLTAHCETKTGLINKELSLLAREIRDTPELYSLIEEKTSRDLLAADLLSAFPEFRGKFDKFLRDHGHREIEFDAYHPTWIEAPWVVLDNLRLLSRNPAPEEVVQKERALRVRQLEAEIALFGRVPPSLHLFFHELLRLTRSYTMLDDLEHYQTTRLTLPLRKGLKEMGHRLVRRNVLSEPMDVFFCRLEQLDEAVRLDDDELWTRLAESVKGEKAAFMAHTEVAPSWRLDDEEGPSPADDDRLTGLPGSPGTAEGEAFLVVSPDCFSHFPKGAVLVARTTNPAWTPLFYMASAVVTESGGPLSHGAVTAREIGIPAVMSVHGIMSRVRNGLRLRVDGRGGCVTIIEGA